MAARRTVLVVGASGLVGSAVVRHCCEAGDRVVALARRPWACPAGARSVRADLLRGRDILAGFPDVTHLVYTALREQPGLVAGWRDAEQIDANDRMFRNALDSVLKASPGLRHVTLLQGTKAYGVHAQALSVPAREDRDEARDLPNFYWRQEDYLRARHDGATWGWTVLRPVLVVGAAAGGALNVLAALGVFAALLKEEGQPLGFPGGGPRVAQTVDAGLLARAIAWCGEAERARNQIFNVTNGDVYVWQNVWPAIANALGMAAGPPTPRSIADYCGSRGAEWDRIRERYQLLSPGLDAFVGNSAQYCDYMMRHGQAEPGAPSIVSTVKLVEAGFHDVIDTEAMFRNGFRDLQARRLLPPA